MSMRIQAKKPKYLPFGYKLMLTYMVFIIIPVIAIGYFSHSMYQDSIRKQTRSNIQGTLLQIRDNIQYKMEDVQRVSSMLYFDYSLVTQLRSYEEGWESYERTTKIVMPKFNIALNATGLDLAMYLFLANDTLPEIYHGSFTNENPEKLERNYNLYHLKRITDKPWYQNYPIEQYGETMRWQQVERDGDFGRISLLRRLVDSNVPLRLKEIGFIRLSVRIQELFQSVDYRKIDEGSVLAIKDEQGNILYQSGVLPNGLNAENIPESHYLTIKETMSQPAWELVAYVPTTIMERDSMKVRMFIIGICLLCGIVFTFAGIFISRYFSIRMTKIVSVLNAFREGDLHKRMTYKGKDEFSQIAVALNEMGQNIGDLIQEVYMTQIQKKEAELESLQAQINPHFLYNTLSSISRLAKFGETDKLHRMVMDLAKFYRLALNDGQMIISVHKELEQAKAYIDIQKIKYGDRMEVMFDIDPDILSYRTVKLVLQPFIENVLEHAWCGDRIHIRVVGKKERNEIVFRIIDDGVGTTAERIRQIFDIRDHVNAGYGIRNVDQRIKLHYGAQYGISIFSRLGVGTSVTIRIPAKRN